MKNYVTMPAYTLYDYRLIVRPHESLCQKIETVRREFAEKFNAGGPGFGKPHLLMTSFSQVEQVEERLLQKLNNVSTGMQPVKIELKDFDSYPTHSIFIKVATKTPLQNLVKKIRTEAQRLMKADADHKPHFILEPTICIARKLSGWQYEQGWLHMRHRHFSGTFIADAMLLLKRPQGDKKFQVVRRFEFKNMQVFTTTQTNLF